MTFRMLKFKPPQAARRPPRRRPSRARAAPPAPARIARQRVLLGGRRGGRAADPALHRLQALRHPPGPMCPRCQSLEWDSLVASGRGHVYSFVVMHHPQFPPFEYPHASR